MFKLILLSCLLVAALAYPHHTPGHQGTQHDHEGDEKVEAAKPAEEKPAEAKPQESEAPKPAEEHKEAEAPAKPDPDSGKKVSTHDHKAPVVPVEAHHSEKPVRS